MAANQEQEVLQHYVRALLARQQALDLLEMIHQQIHQVWARMRKLLDGSGAKAARIARAAQAQNSYRSLEKRREECIATLHQAELRANAALQLILTTPHAASRQIPGLSRPQMPALENS